MELRFSPLFSGSSGNATYVGCDDAHILVDAGVSGSRVIKELEQIGVDPRALSAILVTHEHADHIKGIGILSRKFDLPVYASEGTWRAMESKIGPVAIKNMRVFEPEQDFFVGSIDITPFPIPHDAAQPVGYTFESGGAKLAIVTDLGCVRDSWLKHVYGASAVLLESNYDPWMLEVGPYPRDLKRRINGRKGHLCNDDAADVAAALALAHTRHIMLGHLSKENNYPELALKCAEIALQQAGFSPQRDVIITVAARDHNSGVFSLRAAYGEN